MSNANELFPTSSSSPPRYRPGTSELGLGCVTFGREIDRAGAFAMMDQALAHEMRLFDTAAAYGNGASERIIGEWLASRTARSRVTLATKVLPPYSPAELEAAVGACLHRLGVESVDVLFLHRWHEILGDAGTLRTLDGLV